MTPIETLKRLAELTEKPGLTLPDIQEIAITDFAALADYVEGLREAVRDLSGYGDDPCAMPDELKIKHGIF